MSFINNSLILILSCLMFAMNADGFLLNPGQTPSPGVKSQYISLDMYLEEKKELRNQIFQFQRENEQTLQLLTTQLQQKLSVMDDKLKDSCKHNDTIELANLEKKNSELEVNLTILQEKLRLLQISYVRQKDQLDLFKNTTAEVMKELAELKQLKGVNQTLDLHVVQSKVQSLEQKTNLLTNNQNARSQDFLALYNVTLATDNNVNKMGIHFTNQILSQERRQNATTFRYFDDLTNRFNNNEANQNTTFAEVLSKINSLAVNVSTNSKKGYDEMIKQGKTVAFSAYRSSQQSLSVGTKVLFNQVWTNVGNGYQPRTGIFTAPRAGLYHFTAVVMSTGGGSLFLKMYHNLIATSGSDTEGDGYKTGTFDVVFNLQKGDEVYIASGATYTIYSNNYKYVTFSGHSIF
ncbi:uncharacterized protein LOC143049162 [Mytilus galloprovincialis]|uniref:uncharacterized protein LOC143049162 n=1 Tax=Mytilus galloprovincialis TaxID=29158 RepID=UPI003F7B9932